MDGVALLSRKPAAPRIILNLNYVSIVPVRLCYHQCEVVILPTAHNIIKEVLLSISIHPQFFLSSFEKKREGHAINK